MITSFFKTSKPIHYIIFSVVLIALLFCQRIIISNFEVNALNLVYEAAYFLVVIASLFLVIFIVTKNNLTHNNSFAALYFCLFIGLFPQSLESPFALLSNFCILLSFRRIISLKNKKNIKRKLLDASLWTCLATLLNPFSFFFFAPLMIGIALYSIVEIKNILVPFCGVFAFGIFWTCFSLISNNQLPNYNAYLPSIYYDLSSLSFSNRALFSGLTAGIVLGGIVNYFLASSFKSRFNRASFFLVILMIISSFIAFFFDLSNNKDASIFMAAPSAIILANFSETIRFQWLSDLIIISLFMAVGIQLAINML